MNEVFSKKITEKEINIIHSYIKNYEIGSSNKYIKKIYKTKNYVIQIYSNNKILIQGKNFEWVLKILNCNNIKKNSAPPLHYIGTDESGTGDFFGGICVAAAYVKDENKEKLINLGVKDSKKVNNEYILKIEEQVKLLSNYEFYCINPYEYNELYNTTKNIKKIIAMMHLKAINLLTQKIEIQNIIIDQFVEKKVFFKYISEMNLKSDFNIDFYTKAEDKFFNVAVASIIARIEFLKQIKKLEKESNFFIPLGAVDSKVIPICEKFLKKEDLKNLVKINFKTLEKINLK